MLSTLRNRLSAFHRHPAVRWVVKIMLVAICVMTFTGFFGDRHWVLDLTSHFRVQYLAVQGLFIVLFLKIGRPKWLLAMILCAAVNVAQILPLYLPHPNRGTDETPVAGRLRLLHMNVFKFNHNPSGVFAKIRSDNPDLLCLAEYYQGWHEAFSQSDIPRQYPYQHINVRSGSALYSRFPLRQAQTTRILGRKGEVVLSAEFKLAGQPVTLAVIHPSPPVTRSNYTVQQETYDYLARLRAQCRSFIVAGDFNHTSWSPRFQRFLQETGLVDSRLGFGLQPSWPVHSPVMFMPIDHVLVSPDWVTLHRETGPPVGSDHLPVRVDLGLRAP